TATDAARARANQAAADQIGGRYRYSPIRIAFGSEGTGRVRGALPAGARKNGASFARGVRKQTATGIAAVERATQKRISVTPRKRFSHRFSHAQAIGAIRRVRS